MTSMDAYYEDDSVTLYHGDALDVLPELPRKSADGFVTDPPYIARGGSSRGRHTTASDGQFFRHWLDDVAGEIVGATADDGAGFVFCDWRTVGTVAECFSPSARSRGDGWRTRQALTWVRGGLGMGQPFRNGYEMVALTAGPDWSGDHIPNDVSTVLDVYWPYGRREHHGAEKPVTLAEQLAGWVSSESPAMILDPFVGSGTTAIACKRLGLNCTAIEIEEQYCEVAAERLSQETLKLGGAA